MLSERAVLSLLSQAWQLEKSEREWLAGVVGAAAALFEPELGIVGVIAKASRTSSADLSIVPYAQDLQSNLWPCMNELLTFSRSTNEMRTNFARYAPLMTFSEFSCYRELQSILQVVGIGDVAVLYVGPLFGCSLALAVPYRQRHYFTPRDRETLRHAVPQLSVAFNARRRLHRESDPSEDLNSILIPEPQSVEDRCADLLALGLDTKDIAVALEISVDAARKHISNAMKRHGASNREDLIEIRRRG